MCVGVTDLSVKWILASHVITCSGSQKLKAWTYCYRIIGMCSEFLTVDILWSQETEDHPKVVTINYSGIVCRCDQEILNPWGSLS